MLPIYIFVFADFLLVDMICFHFLTFVLMGRHFYERKYLKECFWDQQLNWIFEIWISIFETERKKHFFVFHSKAEISKLLIFWLRICLEKCTFGKHGADIGPLFDSLPALLAGWQTRNLRQQDIFPKLCKNFMRNDQSLDVHHDLHKSTLTKAAKQSSCCRCLMSTL